MKNKKSWLLGLSLVTAMLATIVGGAPAAAATPKLKIGMAVQDVNNPFWAAVCQNIQKDAQKDGADMSYVACDSTRTYIVHVRDPGKIERSDFLGGDGRACGQHQGRRQQQFEAAHIGVDKSKA